MIPRDTLEHFDAYLSEQHLSLDAVVIGGAALSLLGVVDRQTHDCDILHPELSPAVADAAQEFARKQNAVGNLLEENWLNNGPSSLTPLLPAGWESRLRPAFKGRCVCLRTLGRGDLLRTKLFALCDRGTDLEDCLALDPTAQELAVVQPWVLQQDANPDWPIHVEYVLDDLSERLGHGT